jgi:hypothetical protein
MRHSISVAAVAIGVRLLSLPAAHAQSDSSTANKHVQQHQDAVPAPKDQAAPKPDDQSAEAPQGPGVIAPPATGDRSVITPPATGTAKMPVIPPPGTPGDDNNVEPK